MVTVDKHIRAPRSFLNALEHDALDKISLFANDGEKGTHYLVAESFYFSDQEVKELQKSQLSGTLLETLTIAIKEREDSLLRNLVGDDDEKLQILISKNKTFDESNVAYQIYQHRNTNRVLLIYNAHRMVDFVEKRQLNPNASGEEGLLHKSEALAFHIDPYSKDPWITKLQY